MVLKMSYDSWTPWKPTYDVNPAEAEHTRTLVFADAAKHAYLIGGAHISFPGLGHVRKDGENTYTYVPLNYSSSK
jgi:hypothetical protein